MKYLRKFETEAENLNWSAGEEYVEPNVVLVGETGRVLYNTVSVFIQHVDGTLYATGEWTTGGFTNDLANGVAVIDAACQFVIAKSSITEEATWGNSGLVSGAASTTLQATAEKDFAGAANTQAISSSNTSGGVVLCSNYTFPNGQKGYMPSLGEWLVVRRKKTAIDNALNIIGGELLIGYCWSSTQYDSSNAWDLHLTSDLIRYSARNKTRRVRAFTTLSL